MRDNADIGVLVIAAILILLAVMFTVGYSAGWIS